MLEAEVEANLSRPRPRLRPKFWPLGQSGLDALTALVIVDSDACRGQPLVEGGKV